MEPAEAWTRPCELQLANYWTHEEQPAAGLPLDYASIDIFGDCSHHGCVPESSGGQQLPHEYYYYYFSSISQHNGWSADEVIHGQNRQQVITEENLSKHHQVPDLQNEETKISNDSRASAVFKQVSHEFKADIDAMKEKMHRYPASLRGLPESYTVPRIVAIGPYHHHHPHLKQAEKVKHMAAIRCVVESGKPVQEVYDAVVSAADGVRRLYDKDVMAGIGYDDFRHMMFFDACFLVQFMVMRSRDDIDQSLHSFLSPNRFHIQNDVMLLENQLPWQVVDTVMRFRPVPNLYRFTRRIRGFMQDHYHGDYSAPAGMETAQLEDYKPPHLLGLLRHYSVGTSGDDDETRAANKHSRRFASSSSASAIELAEIGITLKAKNTPDLIRMGLEEGPIFAKLSLAPLTLDRDRASHLVNMAALELCVVQNFAAAPVEDSAVCAYLLLLAMLVYKEEDVDELRARGILEGGGGLTNQETLHFFTSLQGCLRHGSRYFDVMAQIQRYKNKRRRVTKTYAYYYKKQKIICQVVSFSIAVISIFGTLVGILVKVKAFKAAP